ncbi:Tuberous sclerosis 2 protein [Ceratobasidium sp. AG-Ba]|nr:Tuberous sclerosis 2 protein [Ceratobasidium sp. AG-Ba]QRV99315.1 Tuberous sclerosis 2 protein [Ceratobasidium sp. AG-Ba]QRW13817.1 Tuberous sclerosis 2 protein [Ceratobasidium sp. AG-Ba]
MSYTRLKSLFGRLSRRNSSASETSRPASPVPAHSPLLHEYNDLDIRTRPTNITIATPESPPDRSATDADSFTTAQTSHPKRPGVHRRHSSSVSGIPVPKVPESPPPAPPLPIPHRRPTSLALRASSLGRYPITGESAFEVQGESFHERRVASMSSVEREEERSGSRQARGRERHHHHRNDEEERESSEHSGRGPPEAVIGSVPHPNRSTRAFSFLTNFAKRARPPFIPSGGGSSSGREVGRKSSGLFERPVTESEPPPATTSLTTSHALIPFNPAGTFPSHAVLAPTTLSTATSSQFTPAIDSLPPQPIEVLLLALTTPSSATDESAAHLHNPIVLARQLAKQLRNPTNPRGGVGINMFGARGSALVSAGVLGDVIKNLRKGGVGGGVMWDIVGAWLEGDATADIERALLWSALTDDIESAFAEKGSGLGGGLGVFDQDEWAERDRTVRALTDGGKDILGLKRFIAVVGKWVEEGCTVVAASHHTSTISTSGAAPPVYIQAQKSIDASLRLLETVLKHNAPRFGEREVIQVVDVFCRAVERTIGPWANSTGAGGGKLAHKRQASSVAVSPVVGVTTPLGTTATSPLGTIVTTPSPLGTMVTTSPLASPLAAAPPQAPEQISAPPYMVTASRFVALVRALQKWTHVPPIVLQMMLDHLALVLAYVKTPMEVLRLGGRRKSGAGVGAGMGSEGRVDWVDAYSRTELEGEVSGAFKVLLAGPYAVAVGRMLLGLLVPPSGADESISPSTRNALVSLGTSRAIRLSVREAAIPRMARMRFQREPAGWTMTGVPSMGSVSWDSRRGSSAGLDTGSTPHSNTNATPNTTIVGSDAAEMELMELMFNKDPDTGGGGAWETDRIVGVLGSAFSAWVATIDESEDESGAKEAKLAVSGETKSAAESVLIEMLGIVDDLLQEAAEDEKAFGIEEGRVVGEVVAAAVGLFSIYGTMRVLEIGPGPGADSPLLCPVLQTLISVIRKVGLSTPISPPLIQTLFGRSVHLTDRSAVTIIRHYVSMSLVTPSTPAYLDNIRQLAQHFYRPDRPLARVELAQVINKLYFGVRDLAEHRRGVVALCLEIWEAHDRNLVREPELQVVLCALRVLGDAIVAGSVESDGRGKTEERLRLLVALIGRDADCPALKPHEGYSQPEATSPTAEGQTRTRDSSPTPIMSLLNVLTPTVLTPRELPSEAGPPSLAKTVAPVQSPPTCIDHVGDCKAMAAVVTLIQAFSALAFSPPHSLSTNERTARAPASFQCILVMRDLLALLSPVRGDSIDPKEEAAEERSRIIDGQSCCSFARLAILQWLVRLRADRDHRLYMIKDLDKEVELFASLINRTPNRPRPSDAAPLTEPTRVRERERDKERRNRGMTTTASAPDAVRIGRNPSRGRASDSRSRSRQPPPTRAQPPPRYNIWSVPESLPFEVSFGTRPSEGMTTYEQRIEPGEDGLIAQLWLPVSAYVCIMLDLLTAETDWEILSYALCHLPLQMSNKHLFLYDDQLTKNIGPLPAGLKVTDVQGLAYHTLTTLMSYHRTIDKRLQDALLQTFLRGLNKNTTTVKPCLQALAVAAFELQPSMTKFLGEIVDKLSQIMSNPTIAGYILELLCIIGSLPALYANFTDDNYRRVFHVPLQYITLHNRPDSHAGPAGKESYALTQHVLIMAYYQIYVWFLALKLKDRPKHIPYITRHLLLANEHYEQVDEPTEVCFDWLARFTYANAEPKPRMSSLRESVLNPAASPGEGVVSSKSWVFGNSIITIKTLRYSGWLEIECRRPSGLTTFLCKLENVAALGLGEQVTGDIIETAIEGISREPSGTSEWGKIQSTTNDEQPPTQMIPDQSNTPSGILSPSGVTATKEMELDPSYFALLLSPYPDTRRASLRGRLVANDDLLNRTLRSLDRVPVMDLHTVGILYVGPGQTNEREILGNRAGSPAYTEFLDNLGRLIRLKDQRDFYTGGLDSHYDGDGQYAYAWWDVIGQILYHTATLMPNREGDEQFAFKKLHIGNDYVRIVWNDSGKPYRFDTLSTQFQYVNIVIEPHSLGTMAAYTSNAHQDEFFKVLLQRAPGMPEFGMIGEFKIVSAKCLPNVIRQISMLADFFAQIYVHTQHDTVREEYITPWRQRLRQIRMFIGRLPALPVEEPVEGILGQEVARDFSRSY